MENLTENQNSQAKPQNSWSPSDKSRITQALTILINGQKSYGRDASIKDVFAFYQMKLAFDTNKKVNDLRTAAFVVAIDKIAKSYMELGIFP